MVIRIERTLSDGKELKLSIMTNDTAHSVLSDIPELQRDIIDSINTQLNFYLREKRNNNGGVYNKRKESNDRPNEKAPDSDSGDTHTPEQEE
jgi:hypothetical protein